ncbi:TPA: alpha/beta hydrolase [Morganella morganii]
MTPVRFMNANIEIAGNLCFPADFNASRRYPAIIMVHPGGGVKEQTAGLYAEKLAEHGFITLAFDASYQGESSGEPRHLENPYIRTEDISAAVDYLVTRSFIDENRIGVTGICAGGGYAIHAAMIDHRIKAAGTISAVNYGDMYRYGWRGDQTPEQTAGLLQLAAEQRNAEAKGEATRYLPTIPALVPEQQEPDLTEAYDYYHTVRAMHPNAPGKITTRSLAQLITYDAFNHADIFLTQPLLVIAGSEAGTRWLSEKIYQKAASENKTLYVVDGATHIAMYDQPDYVTQAVSQLVPFMHKAL